MKMLTLSKKEAEENGYVSITTPYSYSNLTHMRWLRTVISDMQGCDAVLVEFASPRSVEVWRHKHELK